MLSNGHASILLYSMLYLTGYGLTLDDLKAFRQWGSLTPGHPEAGHTAGVEVTTGPLGQGVANGVGHGLAERWLRAQFGADVVDHHTFVIAGDGCLEEGISHEAASLAGHLGLGRLVYVYDDNHITIDGPTELALNDDPVERFEAYGWHVENVGEIANDLDALEAALRRAMAVDDRPSLVVLRSHIAYPSPDHTDDHEAHGYAAQGRRDHRAPRRSWASPTSRSGCPTTCSSSTARPAARGRQAPAGLAGPLRRLDRRPRRLRRRPGRRRASPAGRPSCPRSTTGDKIATRVASATLPQRHRSTVVPGLLAGAADLTGNTGTKLDGRRPSRPPTPGGRQIHFGIREHAMGGVMNGMALHGGVLPVGGTFFVFSDYMRGAVRLAALSEAKVIYSFTHDSVGVGEDGPTHQPIEHLAAAAGHPRACG